VDLLEDYSPHELEMVGLVDVEPIVMKPTWHYKRSKRASVSKILD
jgi:hypothetical protein